MAITNITLDNTSVVEGSVSGTLVGNITVSGDFVDIPVVYAQNSTQFTVVSGTANKLVVLTPSELDFEAQPTIDVVIGAYITKRITEITKSGDYNVIKTSTEHNLLVGDSIEITSTLNCNGLYTVVSIPNETTFYIDFITGFTETEFNGYVYTTQATETITINVTDSAISKTIINSISPQISKIGTFPEITITGLKFTEGGDPRVILNGTLQSLTSFTDTTIVFTLVTDLPFGVYDLAVVNGYEYTQLQTNPSYNDELSTIQLIRYLTDKSVSYSIGNSTCYVKPTIQLVYDTDGASGKYGSIMNVMPPNIYKSYLYINLKYNSNFVYTTGGEIVLDNVNLLTGDLVWLSNQTIQSENGIYRVSTTAWTFVQPVDINTFIDLGARATDQVDGDITRNIVISQNINFGKSGFYSITYYILNSLGILSKTTRKVKVLSSSASISPIDSYRITDYLIKTEVDPDMLENGAVSTNNSASACCGSNNSAPSNSYINKSGTVAFVANQSMGGHRLTNLGDPICDTDAVNLGTVKELISLIEYIGTAHTAGGHIFKDQIVYIGNDGKVYPLDFVDGDIDTMMMATIGISTEDKNADESINIVSFGKIHISTQTLVVGQTYYAGIDGILTTTPPTTGFVKIMGSAISTTDFILLMQPPIGLEE